MLCWVWSCGYLKTSAEWVSLCKSYFWSKLLEAVTARWVCAGLRLCWKTSEWCEASCWRQYMCILLLSNDCLWFSNILVLLLELYSVKGTVADSHEQHPSSGWVLCGDWPLLRLVNLYNLMRWLTPTINSDHITPGIWSHFHLVLNSLQTMLVMFLSTRIHLLMYLIGDAR